MTSYITYAILSLLLVFVFSKRRIASNSDSHLQPLKLRVIAPKSAPAVAPRPVAKPLPAPQPCLSPIVVGAQQLSLNDAVSDVDLLLPSLSNLSMKAAPLRSCCKSTRFFTFSFEHCQLAPCLLLRAALRPNCRANRRRLTPALFEQLIGRAR
jgi:hypothetical protein